MVHGTRDETGRLRLNLRRDGVPCPWFVHQLILLTFAGPCPEGQECRHGPNGVGDNSLANLSYGTHIENCLDKVRDDTQPRGDRVWNARLTDAAVREIRSLYAGGGLLQRELADRYGVSRRTIGHVIRGTGWKHVA
jgi:hypothetical protein